jgi:hypothetical protein
MIDGVGVGGDKFANLFVREAATQGSTGGITEIEIDENRALRLVFLQKGASLSFGKDVFVDEVQKYIVFFFWNFEFAQPGTPEPRYIPIRGSNLICVDIRAK